MIRKLLLCVFFVFYSVACSSQIYNSVISLDKFDDVIKSEARKTLVLINDSSIVIEEKGRPAKLYVVLKKTSVGSKNKQVNIVNDVYGYTDYYNVITYQNNNPTAYLIEHRTITDHSFGYYITDYLFIWNENKSRIVYSK